jgi:hypothetical protein
MALLTQFIFRLSFGLAVGMAATDPRRVTSGYYRNHLYVLLGINVLITMVAVSDRERFPLAPPLAAAVVSYVGSVLWLYERRIAGILSLVAVAGLSLWGAWSTTDWPVGGPAQSLLAALNAPTSGLLLGVTIAAMFLGHWYLNTPTMAIGPLQRLVALMGVAVALRATVAGTALAFEIHDVGSLGAEPLIFVALRWLAGIVGAALVVVLTWQTLKIPNTQSATGMLYVGVIVTFLGELASLLMSGQSGYPL